MLSISHFWRVIPSPIHLPMLRFTTRKSVRIYKCNFNWGKGNPSCGITCMGKKQHQFYWSCSLVIMKVATPLTSTTILDPRGSGKYNYTIMSYGGDTLHRPQRHLTPAVVTKIQLRTDWARDFTLGTISHSQKQTWTDLYLCLFSEHVSCRKTGDSQAEITVTILNPIYNEVALYYKTSNNIRHINLCKQTIDSNNQARFSVHYDNDVCQSVTATGDVVRLYFNYNETKRRYYERRISY